MTVYTEFRADGWPKCPWCRADELQNPHVWTKSDQPPPTVQEYIDAGLSCLGCGWQGPNAYRSLDARVAEEVMGWDSVRWIPEADEIGWDFRGGAPIHDNDGRRIGYCPVRVSSFSGRMNSAWQVVEKLNDEGWLVTVKQMPAGQPFLAGSDWTRDPKVFQRAYCQASWPRYRDESDYRLSMLRPDGLGDTTPEAICRCALRLRELTAKFGKDTG